MADIPPTTSRLITFRNAFLSGALLLAPLIVTVRAFRTIIDAVGGTVNAVSLTPTFSEPPSAPSSSSASTATAHVSHRYASADDSHITRVAATGHRHDRLAGQIGLSQKNYHDLRAGRGTGSQPRTGYSESGLDASLAYRISSHARLTALAQDFTQDDAWRTHSTVFGSTWLGTRPGNDLQRSLDQSRRLFAVQLHADDLAAPVDELHFSVSHQRQQEDQFRLRHDRRREDTGFAVATLGTFIQVQSPSPFGRWIYGGGRVLPGLVFRRESESWLVLNCVDRLAS